MRDIKKLEPLNPFPFSLIEDLVQGFVPPSTSFDPKGSWTLKYRLHSTWKRLPQTAKLTIERSRTKGNLIKLQINLDRFVNEELVHSNNALMECQHDALTTPIKWSLVSKMISNAGKELKDTRITKEGHFQDGQITVVTNGSDKHTLGQPDAYTSKWGLIDVIQRATASTGTRFHFSLLDDFDRLKGNQELTYLGPSELFIPEQVKQPEATNIGTKTIAHTIPVETFQQLGEGISTTLYWRDKSGLLLFAVAGLEAFVLEEVRS